MNYRIIKWNGAFYIVLGIGYNNRFDPPDVFYAVPITETLFISIITTLDVIEIPFYQAIEITDKSVIQAIWILYGK